MSLARIRPRQEREARGRAAPTGPPADRLARSGDGEADDGLGAGFRGSPSRSVVGHVMARRWPTRG
jgi:hypothetical protein